MIELYYGRDKLKVDYFFFPAGEQHINIKKLSVCSGSKYFTLKYYFDGSSSIVSLLLIVNAIRSYRKDALITLYMPYVPYGRQDRVSAIGEPHSLSLFCRLIDLCKFDHIEIVDPHSDVTEALLRQSNSIKIISQAETLKAVLCGLLIDTTEYALVAPDGGALKKVYACAKELGGLPVVCAEKIRNTTTGEITGTKCNEASKYFNKNILVIDDICDGGRTFIELGKVLRACSYRTPDTTINLYVTHGIFSNGLTELNKYYDSIYCYNNFNRDNKTNEFIVS